MLLEIAVRTRRDDVVERMTAVFAQRGNVVLRQACGFLPAVDTAMTIVGFHLSPLLDRQVVAWGLCFSRTTASLNHQPFFWMGFGIGSSAGALLFTMRLVSIFTALRDGVQMLCTIPRIVGRQMRGTLSTPCASLG
jgi:hypothetical protein